MEKIFDSSARENTVAPPRWGARCETFSDSPCASIRLDILASKACRQPLFAVRPLSTDVVFCDAKGGRPGSGAARADPAAFAPGKGRN
ncbi:MAG: hypothetical protein Kow00133_16150 [Amphiplicatus sp.]